MRYSMLTGFTSRLFAAAAAAIALSLVVSAQQVPPGARGNAAIRLKGATFTPGRGEQPSIPPGLAIAGYREGERGYLIVQFEGPVVDTWKAEVESAGVDLLDYIPDFAFKARMTPGQARQIERLTSVAWVGVFHPAYKLDPGLARDGVRPYTVRIERGADMAAAIRDIAATGATVALRDGSVLTVTASAAQLDAIPHVLDVRGGENVLLRRKNNEYGAGNLMGRSEERRVGKEWRLRGWP